MAITTTEKYTYNPPQNAGVRPFFEITRIQVDTHCSALEDEVCEHYKVIFIEKGKGLYQIDFQEFKIEESGIFCLSPGQIFTVKNEQLKSAYQIAFDKDFYCVETHGKEIACNGLLFNNVHRSTVVSVNSESKGLFKNLIEQMIFELENRGNAHFEMLDSYLRMFLIHTLRLLDTQELEQTSKSHLQDPTVQDFIALVDKHFKSEHTVSGYAEKLFIAPKSLAKKLRNLNYPTPLEIIRERIILEAKRLLKFSNQSVKEIAYELGFEDPAYFSRLFSKSEGISPAVYRNGN